MTVEADSNQPVQGNDGADGAYAPPAIRVIGTIDATLGAKSPGAADEAPFSPPLGDAL